MPDTVGMKPTRRNVIKIKPPLVITDEQVEKVLQVIAVCLEKVSKLSAEQRAAIRQKMLAEAVPR